MKAQKILNFKKLIIIIFSLVLAVSALGLISVNKVRANSTPASPELVLPNSSLEYQNLVNPVDTYSDEQITAVLQKDELLIYKNGKATKINNTTETPVYSVKQVKKLNDNSLLMSTKGRLVTVNLSTLKFDELQFSTDINESGDFFDFNSKYFVLSYGELTIYSFNGQSVSNKLLSLPVNNGTPVAINSKNEVFYINANDKLCKQVVNGKSTELSKETIVANPSSIIASNEYVYYLLGANVYKISVNGGEIIELEKPQSDFDLGKIINPTSISFKGNNLLVTGDNAVQEFKVTEDNKLEFTGFAIAKGKTAYNRASKIKEIERQKDTVATLDSDKLSLIDVSDKFNPYDKSNFEHISINKLANGSKLPDTFALGDSSALFLYEKGNTASRLAVFDFNTKALNTYVSISGGTNFTDVVYQSGKYYVLSHDNASSSKIFVSDEKELSFSLYARSNSYANEMEVDVFGEVYLYGNSNVYTLNRATGNTKSIKSIAGVKKLETDLNGNLFALDDDNAIYCYVNQKWLDSPVQFTTDLTVNKLSSFALDFDKKEVFMTFSNEELIVKTSSLSNLAIDDIQIPSTFITTSNNAVKEFKAYTSIDGANVYSVNKTDKNGFIFNKLITQKTDYAFVAEISKNGLSLYALVGQDDIVLINSKQVVDITPEKIHDVPSSAYITTSVSGYYYPIITAKSDYALTDGEILRLAKEQAISPQYKINFLGKDYYFAEFNVDEKSYHGYVPVDYTIEVLSQDFKWDSYSIETVSKTSVYLEKELLTSIKELENDTKVRLISIEGDIANVAFNTENGWLNGYIKASCLQDKPKKSITNILIIIAVMASVCGTTTYFVLRKRK